MKYGFWRQKKRKPAKNIKDFGRLLEETIRNAVGKEQPELPWPEQVIISPEQMRRITSAWLYEPTKPQRRKRQLLYLMRLYSTADHQELAAKLEMTNDEVWAAVRLLKTFPATPFLENCP
jgi:hypothetical protein